MGNADLHMHSTVSDGGYAPAELMKKCANAGIDIVALTDHDSTAGLREAEKAAETYGMKFIYGIELSTEVKGYSVDILGYGIDPENRMLQEKLQFHRNQRYQRMEEMLLKCASLGMDVSLAEIKSYVTGDTYSRPHLAKALVAKGYAADVQEAFSKYVGTGMPCYAPKEKEMEPLEAMELIRKAGGISIVAHPVYYQIDREIMDWLISGALDGVEIFHRDHSEIEKDRFEKITAAAENSTGKRFFRTGGTDFHHESFGRAGEVIGASPIPYAEAQFLYDYL